MTSSGRTAGAGFIRGRTVARDALSSHLGCSQLEAEELVDTLVTRGFLSFTGNPRAADGDGAWVVATPAS